MNFNLIAFSKGHLLVKNCDNSDYDKDTYLKSIETLNPIVINMQAEVMRYGYMFDDMCLYYLSQIDEDSLVKYAESLADYLAWAYGNGTFVSLFGNFPRTVLAMSETEVFVHQIIHYLSGGLYSPIITTADDTEQELIQNNYANCFREEYKMITPISAKELAALFKSMLGAQQSLTDADKDNVLYLCENWKELGVDYSDIFPEDIPFKETLCILMYSTLRYQPKNINDVLRYVVYLSKGDISLPKLPTKLQYGWYTEAQINRFGWSDDFKRRMIERQQAQIDAARSPFKFCKLARVERREILAMMEHIFEEASVSTHGYENVLADMKKYLGRWIRLGEILHPGEFAKKYPKTSEAFVTLRNAGQYITTYYGRVDSARKSEDLEALLKVYKERPGEFARNLDQLIRNYPGNAGKIFEAFEAVADKVSTKVLYELLDHFTTRRYRTDDRCVVAKGARTAYKLKDLEPLDEFTVNMLNSYIEHILKNRFAETMPSLRGHSVFIEDGVANLALPKNMRSMNFMPDQIARGSVIPIVNKTGIMRLYCRWIDKAGAYDLDLSASLLGEDFNSKYLISWNGSGRLPNNFRNHYLGIESSKEEYWAVFSGDVRHRRGNCAEYVDIDIQGARNNGVRYLVATVCDYDGGGFAAKDAWAGVMDRTALAKGGETTWAPDTISCGFKLTSKCTNIVMTVIDLKEMKMYVVDEDINGVPVASRNLSSISLTAKRYVESHRYFNAASLIKTCAEARGAEVEIISKEEMKDLVERREATKLELINSITKIENLKAECADDMLRTQYDSQLEQLKLALKCLDNVETITYNDLSADYTKLFKWMF